MNAIVCLLQICTALALAFLPSLTRAEPTPQPVLVPLYPAGAATLQGAGEKEQTVPADPAPGQRINSIKNVHVPAIQVHLPPPDQANGTVVIVAPGGGHSQLVWGTEGLDIAAWLNLQGVAVCILKYRLAGTPGFRYTVEGEALQDTQRAIRLVRARASEWRIAPNRVGILGFSAGGALAALANIRFDSGRPDAADPVERMSSRPDFVGLVYPGWSPRMDITAPKDAAPAFLTSAGLDDASHARPTVDFYNSLFKVGVPVELHIYARGGHGGGIHGRKGAPFGTWHHRFLEWMADQGLLPGAVEGRTSLRNQPPI